MNNSEAQNSEMSEAGRCSWSGCGAREPRCLYALLNQHPQIGLMYESDMLTLSPLF